MYNIEDVGDDPTFMDIKQFRDEGYLQELNRGFLHPLGLALAVAIHDDGTETIAGVIDCRDDPEGVVYSDVKGMAEKAANVASIAASRREARVKAIGAWQQLFCERIPTK